MVADALRRLLTFDATSGEKTPRSAADLLDNEIKKLEASIPRNGMAKATRILKLGLAYHMLKVQDGLRLSTKMSVKMQAKEDNRSKAKTSEKDVQDDSIKSMQESRIAANYEPERAREAVYKERKVICPFPVGEGVFFPLPVQDKHHPC